MYLIEIDGGDDDGELRLTKNFVGDTPRYAILSHTWMSDEDELTFADMKAACGRQKPGFAKLQFCAEQARKDDLKYFWMDTCCIDKTSNVELSESITSMFKWYREAAKCYAYLSDVHISSGPSVDFQQSRWFTRGWTLQELLAPRWIEFFSSEGQKIGDRNSLEDAICETTGIPIRALRGRPPSEYTVNQRLEWMEHRQTKRVEDKVYALQGLFDVYIIPNYGEGYKYAMFRLEREIRSTAEQGTSWNASMKSNFHGPETTSTITVGFSTIATTTSGNTAGQAGMCCMYFKNDIRSVYLPPSDQGHSRSLLLDNEYMDSVKPLEQEVEQRERYMGPDHTLTLTAVEQLGTVLQQLQDYDRAAHQFRRALHGREQRGDQRLARENLTRLACALSMTKQQKIDLTFGRRVLDYYLYTRPTGGSGGAHSFTHIAKPGVRVKRLKVWYRETHISGIQLDYTDGSWSLRSGCGEGQVAYHGFEPGEIVKEITVWHSNGTPLVGMIEGETITYDDRGKANNSRFTLGSCRSAKVSSRFSNTGTGILVGVHGYAGVDIDSLGFVFLSPDQALVNGPLEEMLRIDHEHRPYLYGISHAPGLTYIRGAGGNGGSIFEDVASSPFAVKEIQFWTAGETLRAVQVKYDNGAEGRVRGERGDDVQSSFKFRRDEFVTQLYVWTNEEGTRVSRVEIKTNQGSAFESAPKVSKHRFYRQSVRKGAILAGIYGLCGGDVDWLGFIVREPND